MKTVGDRSARHVVALAGAVGLLLAASACGSAADESVGSGATGAGAAGSGTTARVSVAKVQAAIDALPPAYRSSGTLTLAATTNNPPGSTYAEDGKTLVGYNPDIAALLGDALGLRITTEVVDFDQLIPGIQAGRYDATIADLTPNTERVKVLDFVTYAQIGNGLGAAAGNPDRISMDTLCGKSIGFLNGSYQATVELPQFQAECEDTPDGAIDAKMFPEQNDAMLALASDRVAAVYVDAPILGYAARQNPKIEVVKELNFGPVAVGIRKDSGLTEAIHLAMQAIIKDPAYAAVLTRWGIGSAAVTDAKVNEIFE